MIPKRTQKSLNGLQKMCDYINSIYPTKELTILEVGAWVGVSTELFAKNFKRVIAVDTWKATEGINTQYNMRLVEDEFDKILSKYNNIQKIKGKIENVYNSFKDINIVYIDAIHTYKAVKRDIEGLKHVPSKFLCGHDYYGKFPGVIKAVNETFGKPDKVFPDTSWLVKV